MNGKLVLFAHATLLLKRRLLQIINCVASQPKPIIDIASLSWPLILSFFLSFQLFLRYKILAIIDYSSRS